MSTAAAPAVLRSTPADVLLGVFRLRAGPATAGLEFWMSRARSECCKHTLLTVDVAEGAARGLPWRRGGERFLVRSTLRQEPVGS